MLSLENSLAVTSTSPVTQSHHAVPHTHARVHWNLCRRCPIDMYGCPTHSFSSLICFHFCATNEHISHAEFIYLFFLNKTLNSTQSVSLSDKQNSEKIDKCTWPSNFIKANTRSNFTTLFLCCRTTVLNPSFSWAPWLAKGCCIRPLDSYFWLCIQYTLPG